MTLAEAFAAIAKTLELQAEQEELDAFLFGNTADVIDLFEEVGGEWTLAA